MATFSETVVMEKEARALDIVVLQGKHSEDHFDTLSGRREATSVIHEHKLHYDLTDGVDVADQERVIDVVLRNCTIVEVAVVPEVAPTGGDKKYTVDVLLGREADAYASILSAPIEVSVAASSANRKPHYATPTTTAAARGDSIKVVIDAAGSSGSQGQGGTIIIKLREHPAA